MTPIRTEDTLDTPGFDPDNYSCAASHSINAMNSPTSFPRRLAHFETFTTTHIFKITAAVRKDAQCFGNRVYVRIEMPLSPLISGILSVS